MIVSNGSIRRTNNKILVVITSGRSSNRILNVVAVLEAALVEVLIYVLVVMQVLVAGL